MKRKVVKRLLVLLMLVTLVSANTCFVYAEEETSSESSESSEDSDSSEDSSDSDSEDSSDSDSEESESSEKSDDSEKSESSEKSEKSEKSDDVAEEKEKPEDTEKSEDDKAVTDKTEGTDEAADTEEAEAVDEAEGVEDTETEDAESEGVESEEGEAEDTEAEGVETEAGEVEKATEETEETAEEAEEIAKETTFVNKNGEEIVPSELVGTDYDTVADGYDGEINVIKQYATSDEYGANTIMESYVDEDGNLIMVISQGSDVAATLALEAEEEEEEEKESASSAPAVDGSFSGWEDVPVSYAYNWDNSANCWQWGVWVDGEQYKTEEGTYNTDVRHGMQLYTDNEYVYLNVTFAREFSAGQQANGNDYQFWVDGQMAAYQIEWADGSQLSYSNAQPGTYEVDVRHRDSANSYAIADGAVAYYHVNEGNLNNQLEMKIPLEEFVRQNGNINLDNYSMLQFYTPNLMYNKISAAGSPTGSVPFAVGAFLLVPAGYIWLKKKDDKGVSFA